MSEIYDIASEYVDRYAALDPVNATGMGVPGHDAEMTDFSPDGSAAHSTLRREVLARLAAAPETGERDRIAKEGMQDVLGLREDLYAAGDQLRLSGLRNATTVVRMAFDLLPRATPEDSENIAARLALVPDGLARYHATLEQALRRGIPT